jgi:PAS domain S-box-containing protein
MDPPDWPWQALVEHHPDIVLLAARDTTIRYINRVPPPARPEDVVGRRGIDYIVPEFREMALAQFARSWDTGATVEFEVPARGRDRDRTIWHYTRLTAIQRDGRTEYLMAVARDITERRRAEEERRLLEQSLQDARRLESLGILAGGVAHDFNNLLTGIIGFAALARQESVADSPVNGHLQEVEKLCFRAGDLCRQMLAYAGRARLVLGNLDLTRLLEESQTLLRLSVPRNVTLEFHAGADLPPVQADPLPVWQALQNLVVNSAEAIGDAAGVVRISTGLAPLDPMFLRRHAAGRELTAGDYVYLEVRDNGCGMTDEVRSRIFEPFFTTKFTGRGLGLSAVQGTIHGHRGLITVNTAPGEGTMVRLLFPRVEEIRPAASQEC